MGTWGHRIHESDTFADVYDHFFEAYNNGDTPKAAAAQVRSELADYFSDPDDRCDAYFALALAAWETQSLELELLDHVAACITSEVDLKNWERRGADPETLSKRRTELTLFLKQLRNPRPAKKRRKRHKLDFHVAPLVELRAPDDKKTFSINEHFVNGAYQQTVASMMWKEGGGSVFCTTESGLTFQCQWLDAHNMIIETQAGLQYSVKETEARFFKDKVVIHYREIDD